MKEWNDTSPPGRGNVVSDNLAARAVKIKKEKRAGSVRKNPNKKAVGDSTNGLKNSAKCLSLPIPAQAADGTNSKRQQEQRTGNNRGWFWNRSNGVGVNVNARIRIERRPA